MRTSKQASLSANINTLWAVTFSGIQAGAPNRTSSLLRKSWHSMGWHSSFLSSALTLVKMLLLTLRLVFVADVIT